MKILYNAVSKTWQTQDSFYNLKLVLFELRDEKWLWAGLTVCFTFIYIVSTKGMAFCIKLLNSQNRNTVTNGKITFLHKRNDNGDRLELGHFTIYNHLLPTITLNLGYRMQILISVKIYKGCLTGGFIYLQGTWLAYVVLRSTSPPVCEFIPSSQHIALGYGSAFVTHDVFPVWLYSSYEI